MAQAIDTFNEWDSIATPISGLYPSELKEAVNIFTDSFRKCALGQAEQDAMDMFSKLVAQVKDAFESEDSNAECWDQKLCNDINRTATVLGESCSRELKTCASKASNFLSLGHRLLCYTSSKENLSLSVRMKPESKQCINHLIAARSAATEFAKDMPIKDSVSVILGITATNGKTIPHEDSDSAKDTAVTTVDGLMTVLGDFESNLCWLDLI